MMLITTLTAVCLSAAPPIPQNAELQAKLYNDTLAYNRRTLGEVYEKVGKKDPKWDEQAKEAFEQAAKHLSYVGDPPPEAPDVASACKLAINAGCQDPALKWISLQGTLPNEFKDKKDMARQYIAAARALEKSEYPASRRALGMVQCARTLTREKNASKEVQAECRQLLDSALPLLVELSNEPLSRDAKQRVYEVASMMLTTYISLDEGKRNDLFEKVDAELAKVPAVLGQRLAVKTGFMLDSAFAARGAALAQDTGEQKMDKFRELAMKASEAGNASWEADQDCSTVPELMIAINKGTSGDRDDMEKWFERAMKANPNSARACYYKLDWLQPRWFGTREDMLEFGRQCGATKNWRSRIPLLLPEAHLYTYRDLRLHDAKANIVEYFGGDGIWEEIRDVNDEYLRLFPNDDHSRERFACYCAVCKQLAEADKHFKRLGDREPTQEHEFSAAYIARLKEWIEQAKKAAEE